MLANLITNNNTDHPKCQESIRNGFSGSLAYAIAKLTLPNTSIYLDGGNAAWLGTEAFSGRFVELVSSIIATAKTLNPKSEIRGFSTGVSNYEPFDSKGKQPYSSCPKVDKINGIEMVKI